MNRIFIPYFFILYIFKIYLVYGINFQRNCVSSFLNCRSSIFNKKKYGNPLFCYKKKIKAKELRKLTTEQLEKVTILFYSFISLIRLSVFFKGLYNNIHMITYIIHKDIFILGL